MRAEYLDRRCVDLFEYVFSQSGDKFIVVPTDEPALYAETNASLDNLLAVRWKAGERSGNDVGFDIRTKLPSQLTLTGLWTFD
jgi:hypothetical protein